MGVADIPNCIGTEHPGLKCSFLGNPGGNPGFRHPPRLVAEATAVAMRLTLG